MTDETEYLIQPEELIRNLQQARESRCRKCSAPLCAHQALFSVVMGFKNEPVCAPCLAHGLDKTESELRDQLLAHIRRRECYFTAWKWANTEEGFHEDALPACLWPATMTGDSASPASFSGTKYMSETPLEWNAGDLGCGDLVLELRMRLNALEPGRILKVTALDPGAPEDIPAWCNLTGHMLVRRDRADYFIQRKK